MESVKEILMRRDGLSAEDADDRWDEVKGIIDEAVELCDDPFATLMLLEGIIYDELSLEPDYLDEFMDL